MSPFSNTFLLPTGGLSRCWFSSIHCLKLKACNRPVGMVALPLRQAADDVLGGRSSLRPHVLNARSACVPNVVQFKQRRTHASTERRPRFVAATSAVFLSPRSRGGMSHVRR